MADQKIWVADNDRAEKAMSKAVEIMGLPGDERVRLSAAKMILEFTQRKPVAASEHTIHNAHAFLESVLAEENESTQDGA